MYAFVCVCISMCGWFSWFVFILKDFGPFLCVSGYGSVLDFGVHMLLFLFMCVSICDWFSMFLVGLGMALVFSSKCATLEVFIVFFVKFRRLCVLL